MAQLNSISIKELQGGNPKTQRLLYEAYQGRFYALCRRYTNTIMDAEDVMIQGFTKIFNRINSFDGRNFESWMKRIMVNEAINHFHKNKNQTWTNSTEPGETLIADHSDVYSDLSMEDLNKVLNDIPEGCRIIFNLYAIEGYQHKEIAEMLAISESTSKSQYLRAKQMLQNKLNANTPWKREAI